MPYFSEEDIKGFQVTRQGLRVYRDRLDKRIDPRGRPYFWIASDAHTGIPENGTDLGAVEKGSVSVTPLQEDLTAYPAMHLMNAWTLEILEQSTFS